MHRHEIAHADHREGAVDVACVVWQNELDALRPRRLDVNSSEDRGDDGRVDERTPGQINDQRSFRANAGERREHLLFCREIVISRKGYNHPTTRQGANLNRRETVARRVTQLVAESLHGASYP